MFWHNLKYEILDSIRVKDVIIWLMLFPIVLGTFFKIAFGNIYENDVLFSTIKVAIVEKDGEDKMFRQVMDMLSKADDPLLDPIYADEDEALKILDDEEVEGIIYTGDKLSLTVSSNGIEQTVLKSFADQYNSESSIIREAFEDNPIKLMMVVDDLTKEVDSCKDIPLADGDLDVYLQYFYNLIAMVAMFGSITGLHVSIANQANLSALGARKNCSPTPKFITLISGLIGSYVVQGICMVICVTFTAFVLKVDFGSRLPLVYVASLLGGILGVSFGFFVGSIGSWSENTKVGVSMAVSMVSCFLSGLMVGNIKGIISNIAPWFNNINPAAVISDSFYCLNMYEDFTRFFTKLITMCIISAIFIVLGFVMTRRKKYASI